METFQLVLKYAFFGLLQGFTEPIPVSSSGHLVLAQHLLGLEMEGLGFEVLVNFASLLAVLLVYQRGIADAAAGTWGYIRTRAPEHQAEFRFFVYLIIATIPAAVIGILFNDIISESLKGIHVFGWTLLATGAALWLIRNLRGYKREGVLTVKDAVIIGFAQAVALIPGISRSGATIVAAMGLGLNQAAALKFSFFLFIPISVGSMLLEGAELLQDPRLFALLLPYTIAFLCSFFASYYSLRWFMGIMERGNIKIFAYYCFFVGTWVLLFL